MELKNELTLKRLRKEFSRHLYAIMSHEEISLLDAKTILIDIINSEEVKEQVIRQI